MAVSELSEVQLKDIDSVLIAATSKQWRKLARIVGTAMMNQKDRVASISDIYYAQRVYHLVETKILQAYGSLNTMRMCEARFSR